MLTSAAIQKMKNEVQALKVVQPINGGALTRHSATATWQGTIDKNAPISEYSCLAAFVATFERRDGIVKVPLVQFAYELDPDHYNDHHSRSYSAIISASGDTVSYKIVLSDTWWPFDAGTTTGTLKITVNAYSMVEGNLTIERVYS